MASSQIELQRFEDAHQTSGVWQDQSRMPSDAEAELESPNSPAPHEFSLPPVDRGKDAWLFLAASFVIEALVWGFPFTYGVFQDYYTTHEPFAGSRNIAVIGTCAMGIMYLDLPIIFAVLQIWPRFRPYCTGVGLFIMCLALGLSSFATTTTHLMATQGIFYAIGGSLAYSPCIIYMDEWFVKRKGLAFGIMWAGTGLAGVILPLAMQVFLEKYGYKTTLRAWAVALFVLTAPLLYFVKPRVPLSQSTQTRRIDFSFLNTKIFGILQACNVIEALGFFLPSIYLPSYARTIGASSVESALTVVIFNVASVFGCVAMGSIVDKYHVTTCIVISTIGSTVGIFVIWGFSVSLAPLYVFCIIYGLFAGSFTSTYPGIMRAVQKKKNSADPVMVFACLAAGRGIGNVASGPLSEILIRGMPWKDQGGFAYGSGYGPLIVFTGVTAFFGGASVFGRRVGLTVAENGGDEKLLTNELPTVTNNHGLPTPALDLPGCYMTKSMVVVESWGQSPKLLTMAAEAAKNLQGNRTRPRSIVPAIPLPYVQKRKLAAAPRKEEIEIAPNTAIDSSTSTSNTSSAIVEVCRSTDTNGTSEQETTQKGDTVNSAASTLTSEVEENQALDLPDNNLHTNGQEYTGHEVATEGYDTQGAQPSQTTCEDKAQIEKVTRQVDPVPTPSDKQPGATRSSYNMPPAQFIPGQHTLPNRPALDTEAPTYTKFQVSGGPHPMHRTHPSQGSLVFGGYPDSNNSSPAPPLSSAGMPQYPYPPPPPTNGHMHHPSNGFQVPPPPGFGFQQQHGNHIVHSPAMEGFGRRHPPSFPHPEGYSPSATPGINDNRRPQFYDPSTSHSLRSHSSAPRDLDPRPTQFPNPNATPRATNGSNGRTDDAKLYHQPQMSDRSGSGPHGIVPLSSVDNLDGLLGYIQGQFADPTFSDYTLEVRYTDDRAKPMRIPGHNLLFARSPALKRLMISQANDGSSESASRTILIETADRFLCSDGFWIALQRLYGGPLLSLDTPPTPGRTMEAQNSASSNPASFHRFDLALGYAAAGQILQIPPVLSRGIEVACHLVNWLTLEKALDFALDGGLGSQWTLDNNYNGVCPSTYGPAVDMLIHSALGFLIANFPPHLDLDVTAPEPPFNSRLPVLSHSKVSKHNPRLSSIKFGDHPVEEPILPIPKNANPASLISGILINLPFQLLKYVLEAPSLGIHDWATSAMRQTVMHEVISEREKRRNRVRDDRSVSNDVRISNQKEWQSVGWQEGVEIEEPRKMPTLTKTWVDFRLPE
ncbi:hypothetical protein V498_04620 [Pseudogymnoascus sp. VKM F-4517 (FW-2822)]|nr:hypothetical protein V498_04620 [Pseudogymnoascus sp. VKM F-4517 (FW-2822)]